VLGEIDGRDLEAVLVSEDFGSAAKEETLLRNWLSKDVRVCRTSETIFRSVSDVRAPQGAIALVRLPERTLEEMPPDRNPLVVFACGVQDPGNLGTIVRASAAAGASLVCIGKETVSPWNPKAIRASAGTVFRIPIVDNAETARFLAFCESRSIQAYRTDVRQGMPHTRADLKSPCAVVLGNEGSGIAGNACTRLPAIRIPMARKIESLNVAMAGAIILFEALRQRTNE
jgi:TrmH family RNA methyltransferase